MAENQQQLIRACKDKQTFFAFCKNGNAGEIELSKNPLKSKNDIHKKLKKESGGSKVICGVLEGPLDDLTVIMPKVDKTLAPILIKAIKKATEGIKVFIDPLKIKSFKDAGLEDEGGEDEGVETPEKPVVTPQQPEQTPEEDIQDAPPEQGEVDWKPYHQAREQVVSGIKALAAKVAATKHASAAEVLKEINGIIKKLPTDPDPAKLADLEKLIESDDGINAAEEAPAHFHQIEIKKPLLAALAEVKKARTAQPVA